MSRKREDTLRWLQASESVSVLIIGGGINGAGLYRELALQGIDTLLIDREDFSSGASSATSRMVHGGLRYLENGEFKLVRESLLERNRLLRNAPHAVRPIPTNIPIYKRFSGLFNAVFRFLGLSEKPAERGALIIKLGLTLYDFFTRKRKEMPRHFFRGRRLTLDNFPNLNPKAIASACYYDAFIAQPQRLCWELIDDAETACSEVHSLNYIFVKGSDYTKVILQDEESGAEFEIKPSIVVNATGAWIDFANEILDTKTSFMGGTKGSHMILDQSELRSQLDNQMFFYENKDGRICLVIPYGKHVLLGTTDIRIDNPDQAACSQEEIDYLLSAARGLFPDIEFKQEQIIATYCGVRPLPASKAGFTGRISRSHECRVMLPRGRRPFPVYCLIGGKWTTFRSFSEQVCNRILDAFECKRSQSSGELAIGGGKGFPGDERRKKEYVASLVSRYEIEPKQARLLLERYGTRSEAIAAYAQERGYDALPDTEAYSEGELRYLIENEQVTRLEDLVLRRTNIAFEGALTEPLLQQIAKLLGEARNWDASRVTRSIAQAKQVLSERHGITIA